ncbi:MAG: putative bifunctional diguanylate cyclase/phosphodiesterase [Janthinobacterium lividum]
MLTTLSRRGRKRMLYAIPALGAIIIALLWTVIFARLSFEKENVYHDSASSAAILSSALEQHTVKAIHQVDQVTRFVKFEYEKSPSHFDLISTVNKGVVQNDTLLQISIIDEQGLLRASTVQANAPAGPPVSLADREHFRVHRDRDTDQLFISKPVLGRVSGQWSLQMTRRLNHPDGSFAGVVVVSEDPTYFTNDFYNKAALGHNGMIAVIADNGAVLARSTDAEKNASSTFSASGSYPIARHMSGTYRDPIDGIERIVSFRHLDGYPMGVLVGLSVAEELAQYRHTRNVYVLMAGFISLAMAGFFGVATGLIAKLLGRERDMTMLAENDPLTGLPNRYRTLLWLRQQVAEPDSLGHLALLFIDIDNFKTVNDTLGHNAGDSVLQMSAQRLADTVFASVAEDSFLSRVGGDEFLVGLRGPTVEAQAVDLAEAIAEALRKPFDVRDRPFVLSASIGISLHSISHESEIDLLKKADLAMYSAKEAGKGCYQFFSPHLSHRADHLMKWEQQLRVALDERQLFLEYQPKIALDSRRITGFEALVRWQHPEHGLILAGEFIPIAERTGLIVRLGEFVIETACRQLNAWQAEGWGPLSLAVNISSMQFWRGDLLEVVERCQREYLIGRGLLELEITETAMMEYPELVAEKIGALKRMGVRIALDDFGTGYSSLSYLNRFAVDTLKVDRSFVQSIPDDPGVCAMISAIIGLARSLELTVVVEGIETEEQSAWLQRFGGIEAQGFLFSRPIPAHAVADLIKRFGVFGVRD